MRLCTLAVIAVVWGVKEQRLSSVTPKILGLFTVGILVPSTEMFRSSLYSFVQFVNMVAVDLVGKKVKLLATRKVGEIAVYFRAHVIY